MIIKERRASTESKHGEICLQTVKCRVKISNRQIKDLGLVRTGDGMRGTLRAKV